MKTPTVSITLDVPVWFHALLVESAALEEEPLAEYVAGVLLDQAKTIVEECAEGWYTRDFPEEKPGA